MMQIRSRCISLITGVFLAACTLPSASVTKQQFLSDTPEGEISVTRIGTLSQFPQPIKDTQVFSSALTDLEDIDFQAIRAGDTLTISIFESITSSGTLMFQGGQTHFENVKVSDAGTISIPFAGTLEVAEQTPAQISAAISERLQDQILNPQANVQIVDQPRGHVTIIGSEEDALMDLQAGQSRLSAALALAKNTLANAGRSKLTLRRGGLQETITLEAFLNVPENDIKLRDQDIIILSREPAYLVALGAIGKQQRLEIPSSSFSLLAAISEIQGLNDDLADPSAVFLIRSASDTPLSDTQIYGADLTSPFEVAAAGKFQVEDGDIVYVSNANFAQANKALAALTAGVTAVGIGVR